MVLQQHLQQTKFRGGQPQITLAITSGLGRLFQNQPTH